MEINDVLAAFEAALHTKYPEEPVYYDELPKGFKRPSFTLECNRSEVIDVNLALVQHKLTVLVTSYVEVNAHSDSSRAELNRRESAVLTIFGAGYLRVGDRCITVSAAKGAGAPDFSEITVVVSWMDARVRGNAAETAPLMENFEINRKE